MATKCDVINAVVAATQECNMCAGDATLPTCQIYPQGYCSLATAANLHEKIARARPSVRDLLLPGSDDARLNARLAGNDRAAFAIAQQALREAFPGGDTDITWGDFGRCKNLASDTGRTFNRVDAWHLGKASETAPPSKLRMLVPMTVDAVASPTAVLVLLFGLLFVLLALSLALLRPHLPKKVLGFPTAYL